MIEIIIFTIVQLVSIIIGTLKYVLTGNAKPWVATVINAASCAVGNLATIFLVKQDTTLGILITFIDTLIGVPFARFLIDKFSKDRLFIFNATVKCNEEAAHKIKDGLKLFDIQCNWQPIAQDKLYTFSIYSYSKEESKQVKMILSKFKAKYHIIEAR